MEYIKVSKGRRKKILSAMLAFTVGCTNMGVSGCFAGPLGDEKEILEEALVAEKVIGAQNSTEDKFTWDNATVYFALTDRFYNGNVQNDHSYGRSVEEADAENYATRVGTFHGGDLAGLTLKLKEGYFDDLGVNVIWISAPYENSHGAVCGEGFKYYAYHGCWPLDFSQLDANVGTEEEMAEFVKTAHQHGIRVVYDVVMNNVGYADPITVSEYVGDGALTSDWKTFYYGMDEEGYRWYHNYTSETEDGIAILNSGSSSWIRSWWGTDWVRAVTSRFQGYEGNESYVDNLKCCLNGLPDIRTEDEFDYSIPTILKTKWTIEGNYGTKMEELNGFFETSNLPKRNVNYVIAWLSSYVENYGIDGFRCDAVKYVEPEHWATLKEVCNERLQKWRMAEKQKENPDPACNWDENFWMAGEIYGWSGGKNSYLTSGGFDALGNYGFQSKAGKTGADLETTYADYANTVNSNASQGYNLLSFVSSNSAGLGALGSYDGTSVFKNTGAALLLCPGAVQIYYGDEYGRDAQGALDEQGWNSQMEFGKNTEQLTNWQKIGNFRKNHPAVGAGAHTMLSKSVYTFSRTYHVGESDEDKVIVALPVVAGEYDVNVGTVFEDGETVKDAYSGKTYIVQDGVISASCDDNGVILLEAVEPYVAATITRGSSPFATETIELTLSAAGTTESYYAINGEDKVAYDDGDKIEIGAGSAYDEITNVTLSARTNDGSFIEQSYIYIKCSEPEVDCRTGIRVLKSEFAEAPYCFAYIGNATILNGSWPGNRMTSLGDYWVFIPDAEQDFSFILSDGTGWRSPEESQPGLETQGNTLFTKTTGKTTQLAGSAGRVNVKYVNEAGEELKTGVYRIGGVGDTYETSAPKSINGARLIYSSGNTTGTFTEETIEVIYTYQGGNVATSTPTVTNTPTPTVTNTLTPTVTNTPTPTVTNTPTPTVTNTPIPTTTMAPEVTEEVVVTGIPSVTPELAKGKIILHCYSKEGQPVMVYQNRNGVADREYMVQMSYEENNWFTCTMDQTDMMQVRFYWGDGETSTEWFEVTNGEWWYLDEMTQENLQIKTPDATLTPTITGGGELTPMVTPTLAPTATLTPTAEPTPTLTSKPESTVTVTKAIKPTAKPATVSYRVTYQGNGGKIGNVTLKTATKKKNEILGTLPTPKRSGYQFLGWYTRKTGGSKVSGQLKVQGNLTLYAQWQKKLGKTKITVTADTKRSYKVSFKKVKGAKGYEVYRSTKKKSGYKKIASLSSKKSNYVDENLVNKKTYYYYVLPYQTVNGKKSYGAKSNVVKKKCIMRLNQPKMDPPEYNPITKHLDLSWKKVENAQYYKIYCQRGVKDAQGIIRLGDSVFVKKITKTGCSVDVSKYETSQYWYHFSVVACTKDGKIEIMSSPSSDKYVLGR